MISPLKIVGVSFLSFLGFACSDDPETDPNGSGGAGAAGAPANGGATAGSSAGGSGGTANGGAMGGSGGAMGGSATGGSGGAMGGGPSACMPIAAPAGSMLEAPKLVIAEIALGGAANHIVLYNNSAEPLDLAGFGLCSDTIYYTELSGPTGMATLAPGAFVTLDAAPGLIGIAEASPEKGELLVVEGSFNGIPGSADDVHDYVCWGSFVGGRKEKDGGEKRFFGDCAGAMTNGALQRIPGTSGEDAASYDSAAAAACGM